MTPRPIRFCSRSAPGRGLAREVNDQIGGEDAEEGLVVHYGPGGLPHAFEIEHASERPELVARTLAASRHAKGFAA